VIREFSNSSFWSESKRNIFLYYLEEFKVLLKKYLLNPFTPSPVGGKITKKTV